MSAELASCEAVGGTVKAGAITDLDALYGPEEFSWRRRRPYVEYAGVLKQLFQPASFLDLGCANGFTIEYFAQRGVHAVGVEGASAAFDYMPEPVRGQVLQFDLRNSLELGERFDLVNCTEVAEHLEPKFEDVLMGNLVRHAAGWVVFSASPSWDKFRGTPQQQHWNVRPRQYWTERLGRDGLLIDEEQCERMRDMLAGQRHVYSWWADDLIVGVYRGGM